MSRWQCYILWKFYEIVKKYVEETKFYKAVGCKINVEKLIVFLNIDSKLENKIFKLHLQQFFLINKVHRKKANRNYMSLY